MKRQNITHQPDFEKSFLEAIDEGLSSLGQSGKQAVYFYLESQFHLDKQKICKRVKDFADGLEKIFGWGASFLEILIMKQLYEKLGRTFKLQSSENLDFVTYVNAVRHGIKAH
jgi:hypothetical protein